MVSAVKQHKVLRRRAVSSAQFLGSAVEMRFKLVSVCRKREELTGQQEEECISGRGHTCESPAAEGAGEWCKMTQKGGQGPDYTGPRRLHQRLVFIPRSFGRVLSREMIHLCLEDHSGYTVNNEMKWGKNRNIDQFRRLSQQSR